MKKFENFVLERITTKQQQYLDTIVNYLKENGDEDLFEYNEFFIINKEDEPKLTGKLYLTENNRAVRFNFQHTTLHSIDLWDYFEFKINNICNQPTLTMLLNTTVVDGILDDIVDFFDNDDDFEDDFEEKKHTKKPVYFSLNQSKEEPKFTISKSSTEDVELKTITISKEVIDTNLDVFEAIELYAKQVAFKVSNALIVSGMAGVGKCLGKGTKIIMFDGTLKNVEDIKIGEQIMGPDSKPRNILNVNSGIGNLYEIHQNKGIDYVVNENHLLSLKKSISAKKIKKYDIYDNCINIPVGRYLEKTNLWKRHFYGYKVDIDFEKKDVPIDPYWLGVWLGVWLGDGTRKSTEITTIDHEIKEYIYEYADNIDQVVSESIYKDRTPKYRIISENYQTKESRQSDNLYNKMKRLNIIDNKHIPDIYLYNDKKTRLELLAGIMDTDGYTIESTGYEITQKSEILIKQIKFLADSLGFKTALKKRSCSIKKINFKAEYYRLSINGNLEIIPVKIERKKVYPIRKVDHKITGIKVKPIGVGEYYGFEIDGDHLFLLEDCTVAHNTNTITETLYEMHVDYEKFSGNISAAGLFETLFLNRKKLLLFDDCNSVWGDEECINILQSALDTYKKRKISRMLKTHFDSKDMTDAQIQATYLETGKLPKQFDFEGQIIFITNTEGEDLDPTIISRCLHVDVNLSRQEILDRMRKIMEKLFPQISIKIKEETLEFLDYITSNYQTKFPLNIRTLIHSINIRIANDFLKNVEGTNVPIWQMLIKTYLIEKKQEKNKK